MTSNQPILTRAQAHFLTDLDLTSFTRKVEAIERAKQVLQFKDDSDRENFYLAVERGYWDARSDFWVIAPLAPFNQKLFVGQSTVLDEKGNPSFYLAPELENAKLFTKDELEKISQLEMYNREEFVLNEYTAVKLYGDVKAWLQDDQFDGNDALKKEVGNDQSSVPLNSEAVDENLDEKSLEHTSSQEVHDVGSEALVVEDQEVVSSEVHSEHDEKLISEYAPKEVTGVSFSASSPAYGGSVVDLVDQNIRSLEAAPTVQSGVTVPVDISKDDEEADDTEELSKLGSESFHAKGNIRVK